MAGGSWEYTASYLNNGNSDLTRYGSSLVNADEKYKNIYNKGVLDNNVNNYNENMGKYGDALYETSQQGFNNTAWFNNRSNFPIGAAPFFLRGGSYNTQYSPGLFFFQNNNGSTNIFNGGASYMCTFHVVLVL